MLVATAASPTDSTQRTIYRFAGAAAIMLLSGAAVVGLAGGDAAFARMWWPSALAIGMVVAWGSIVLPAVLLGALGAAWYSGSGPVEIVTYALAAVLPAWGARVWIQASRQKLLKDSAHFAQRSWPRLMVVGVAAAILLVSGDVLGRGQAGAFRIEWFALTAVGQAVSALIFVPFFVAWSLPKGKPSRDLPASTLALLIAAPIGLALGSMLPQTPITAVAPLTFAVAPALVLLALYSEIRRTSTAITLVAVASLVGTSLGGGMFGNDAPGLTSLALFLAAIAFSAQYIVALRIERSSMASDLMTKERRWQVLVAAAPETILSVERSGRVMMTNQRGDSKVARLAVGDDFFQAIDKEDHENLRDRLNIVFMHGTAARAVVRVPTAGSAPRLFAFQLGPLREGDAVVGVLVIGDDVTKREALRMQLEESETRLRAFYERSPVPITLLGTDGRMLETNTALAHLLGAGDMPLDEFKVTDVVHPEDRRDWLVAFEGLARGNCNRFESEIRLVKRDGHAVWVRATVHMIRGDEDAVRLVVAQWEDLSAQRQAEQAELVAAGHRERIGELEEVSAWKSELLNIASHEIRNPLTPMKLQLDLMDRQAYGPMTEKQERAVQIMRKECDRLAGLVTGILDVARIETGKLAVRQSATDMVAIIQGAAESFRALADEKEISLQVHADGPTEVIVDADRIQQVGVNLLSNAIKFTNVNGNIEAHVKAVGDAVEVRVKDDGPGLDDTQKARLFRAFTQVHDVSRGDAKGGIGLGLYISKGIVEAHGGRIWVESDGPGLGTTFAFSLPRGAQSGPKVPAEAEGRLPASQATVSSNV